jgi:hypothetical protein
MHTEIGRSKTPIAASPAINPLDHDNTLDPYALLEFVVELNAHPDTVSAACVYFRRDMIQQVGGFDLNKWLQKAFSGEFLFVPTGGGSSSRPASFYGEAIITKSYLGKVLPDSGFEIVCFSEDTGLPQTFVVLRKASK